MKMYVFTKPLHHEQDVIQGKFLSEFAAGLNSEFSSPRLVA